MLKFVADENFNNNILRGIQRQNADVEILRIQDVGLSGASDPTILAWAAEHGRILLTHDVATITRYAYERIMRGEKMPGVFEVNRKIPLSTVIEDILLLAQLSIEDEWENQVCYLPLATDET